MDPKALKELIPDFIEQGAPVESPVKEDYFLYLTKTRAIKSPITPPPLKNHGYYIVSLNKLTAWLGEKCEEAGVNIFPEFPGAEILYDDADRVVGVRTGDKGIDKEGRRKSNFEPGVDILAKVTVLGEGPRGSLTKQLTERLGLNDGREPQVYSIGVKELWELPDDRYPAGRVTHTLGYPSDAHTYGGGWIYGMQNRIINLGYVTGLDYSDPLLDPHAEFQRFKEHPFVARLLEGGRMIRYGAKTIAAGGFYAIPQFHGDGFLLVGDSAGFLNSQRLKGIHTAIKSGMLAAQAVFEALLVGDFSKGQLKRDALRRRVRQPLPALLPRGRLRDGRGRPREAPFADQLLQLRPLQDVRHHGPLPDHQLGDARRRRRAGLQGDVRKKVRSRNDER